MRYHTVDMARDHLKMHFGAVFSITEMIVSLYFGWMKYDPKNPKWLDRDRFILSKGHAAPAIYIVLAEAGYYDLDELKVFSFVEQHSPGTPCRMKTPGVEVSSGSLGTGIQVAVGMAIAAKMDHADWRVYVILSDAECNEGGTWEALQVASNHHPVKLKVYQLRIN